MQQKELEGDQTKDPEVAKAELHQKLSMLVNGLVNKIQAKHESLIDKQKQLAQYQQTLKAKYNPVFDQMDSHLKDKMMEYVDHLTTNLE